MGMGKYDIAISFFVLALFKGGIRKKCDGFAVMTNKQTLRLYTFAIRDYINRVKEYNKAILSYILG